MPQATPDQIAARVGGHLVTGIPRPSTSATTAWTPPTYAGSDANYQAWLANANMRGTNVLSDARMRRAQAEEAYRQAMDDLEFQSTNGRRQLQGNMLARGMFQSGETGRRKQEFDSSIEQGKQRSTAALTNQIGSIEAAQRDALANLSSEALGQVSQATLRDQLAAYNAQQSAAPATYATPQQQAPTIAAKPATPNQAGVDPRYRVPAAAKPKPKVASGSTGSLKLGKKGALQ